MLVAHAVLVPVWSPAVQRCRLDEILHVAVKVHFQVDADTPVECRERAEDVNVCNAHFHDLGFHFTGLLVGGDTDFGIVVARVQLTAYGTGEIKHAGLGELVEGVAFPLVDVIHGDAGFRGRRFGLHEGPVQELIKFAVLRL